MIWTPAKSSNGTRGILQRKHSLTEEQAYFRLWNLSRRPRRPLRELAEAIIIVDTVERDADPVAGAGAR